MYFVLEPEVAGGFGPATVGDLKARPPRLIKFNYEFDVWPRDSIIEAISNFIVTNAIKEQIIEMHTSGMMFNDVDITKSGIFQDMHPDCILPKFSWLQITGKAGSDDFGLSASGNLVVSDRVMKLLESVGLNHCEVSEYDPNSNS